MTYIKNQLFQNNAFGAWAMTIRYCDCILEGKVASGVSASGEV